MQSLLRVALVAVVLASVAPAYALSVSPAIPTSSDEITLLVPTYCGIRTAEVTRTGRDISVTLTLGNCNPPYLTDNGVPLGKLPAGEYHAVVTVFDLPPQTGSFIVFEADPIVTVRPFVVPPNIAGYPIELTFREGFDLGDPNCGKACYIEIGGVKFIGYAPNLTPGIHDIRIVTDKGTFTSAAAIYYQSADTPPHPQIFEHVLFPVLSRSDGAHGSQWRSEAVISNPTRFPILNANAVGPHAPRLEPRTRVAFDGEQYPYGVALMVPRREVDNLAFRLRIRDVSREADNFGTDIPVVREKDLVRNGELTLLDVPLDPRYRTKLRLYFFPQDFTGSWVGHFSSARVVLANGTVIYPQGTFRERNCTGAACAWTPHCAEIDLPARAQGERADVYVEFGVTPGWAFASVTNNKTQQVTIVTPDGHGGHPQ